MDEHGLTVSVVARRLGVAPATLRTWDRRYGLGPADRAGEGRRLYGPADVERLTRMRQHVQDGLSPARAAELALSGGSAGPGDEDGADSGPGSGGRVLALPRMCTAGRGLAAAAMAMDADGCHRIVSQSLAARGVLATWDELLTPVLVAVGARWEDMGDAIDVEHLLSEVILGCLAVVARPSDPRPGERPVLLVGSEGESHSLPLHALSAALREQRVDVRMLGTGAPATTVSAAVQRLGPRAVVVWAQLTTTATTATFDALPAMRPPVVPFAAGPGWQGTDLPPQVRVLVSLADGVARLSGPDQAAARRRTRTATSTTTSASAPKASAAAP